MRRFISACGLVAVVMLIVTKLLATDVTAGFQPAALLFLPIALNARTRCHARR